MTNIVFFWVFYLTFFLCLLAENYVLQEKRNIKYKFDLLPSYLHVINSDDHNYVYSANTIQNPHNNTTLLWQFVTHLLFSKI